MGTLASTNKPGFFSFPVIIFLLVFLSASTIQCDKEDLYTGPDTPPDYNEDGYPQMATALVTNITHNSATCGGNVSSGGPNLIRGVCWSTSPKPTTSDSLTTDGIGEGSFTSEITGLTSSTKYYVRAYATNSRYTGYGYERNFITLGSGCEGITFVNYQGQIYNTVEIGTQCWFKENLNYAIGNSLCYDNNPSNCDTYGRLYDWPTALSVCPSGWHLPDDGAWTLLTDYLGGESVAGGKMKEAGTTHWVSPNTGATNSSGFTALPGGWSYLDGYFDKLGLNAYFWSSTEQSSSSAWRRMLHHNYDYINRYGSNKESGFSVRCIKD